MKPFIWPRYGKGITVATGVSQWSDASGSGNHLIQATAGHQPVLQSDSSILFDSLNFSLQTGAFAVAQPLTIYVLGKMVTWLSGTYMLNGRTTIQEPGLRMSTSTPNIDASAGTLGPQSTDLPVGIYGAIAAVFNGTGAALQVNQRPLHTGDCGTTALTGLTVGANNAGGNFGNVQIKEIIGVPVPANAYVRSRVVKYLRQLGRV